MKILGWRRQSVEETEVQEAQARDEMARIFELVTRPGYKTHLVDWLKSQMDSYRIKPGDEKSMLYQIGFRDGLELVYKRLTDMQEVGRRSDG